MRLHLQRHRLPVLVSVSIRIATNPSYHEAWEVVHKSRCLSFKADYAPFLLKLLSRNSVPHNLIGRANKAIVDNWNISGSGLSLYYAFLVTAFTAFITIHVIIICFEQLIIFRAPTAKVLLHRWVRLKHTINMLSDGIPFPQVKCSQF